MHRHLWGLLKERWEHRTLGELYMIVTSLGAFVFSVALLFAPISKTSSPSLATLYAFAPRHTWGVIFLLLAILAAWGAARPTEERFIGIMSIEVFAQAAWAIGLSLPSFTGQGLSNILAPIAWLQLAGTACVVILAGRRPVLPPRTRNRRSTDTVE